MRRARATTAQAATQLNSQIGPRSLRVRILGHLRCWQSPESGGLGDQPIHYTVTRCSAATASSTDCCRASAAVRVCQPGDCDQWPKERNPIFFIPLATAGTVQTSGSDRPREPERAVRCEQW
jgi:hypothetical protein